jgi:endonuclease/exonuclease/phosphatase family metal-dependent hydrolase
MPMLSLDRVFLNKITPILAVTLKDGHWKKLSDHLPLYVELEIED